MSIFGRNVSRITHFHHSRIVLALGAAGFFCVGLLGLGASSTEAAVGINQTINYQGRLLNAAGAVVPDGNYNMRFKLYQDGDGVLGGGDETLRYTEIWQNSNSQGVTIKNGYFSLAIGTYCAFAGGSCQGNTNAGVSFNQDTLWLSIDIGGTATGASPTYDGEMSPFKRLGAAPYALQAADSSKLGGLTSSQFVQLGQGLQTDATNNGSIAINKTSGTGNILDLQRASVGVAVITNTGAATFQNTTDSGAAFQVRNQANHAILTVDTTGSQVVIGKPSTITGKLQFSRSDDGNVATLTVNDLSSPQTINLPDSSGTICLDSGNCGTTIGKLQNAYSYSTGGTSPEIKLDGTRNGIEIQDADSTIGNSQNFLSLRGPNAGGLGTIRVGFGINGNLYMQPGSDTNPASSDSLIDVNNAAGNNVLTVETFNGAGRVGVALGSANNPTYPLDVGGDINTSTQYRIGGGVALTSSALSFTAASTATIQPANSQALNITANNSSTWSTSSGDLAIQAASNLNLGNGGGTAINLATAASGSINIGTNAVASKTINIGSVGTDTNASTINIANTTNATAAQAVTIGSTAANTGNLTIIQGGSNTTQAIQLLPATAGGIMVGAAAGTGTITLGRSTATSSISIGSANLTSLVTQSINIGNGSQTTGTSSIIVNILSGAAGNAGAGQLYMANNDRVTQVDIGNVVADAARTFNLFTGNATAVDTINIGTGAGTVAGAKTINIGNGTPTGSGSNLVSIGSTALASALTLQAGSGNATMTAASGTITLQTTTSGAINLRPGGTSNIVLGTSDTTGTLLVMDHKTDATDPTGVEGGIYYNFAMKRMRCYQDSRWQFCNDPVGMTWGYNVDEEFIDFTPSDAIIGNRGWLTAVSGGTVDPSAPDSASRPGQYSLSTGTGTTGWSNIYLNTGNSTDGGREPVIVNPGDIIEFAANIPTLAVSGGVDYFIRMGLYDSDGTPSDASEGVYIEYNRSQSTNWRFITVNGGNSTGSRGTSSLAVTAGWHYFKIVVNSSTSVSFYVDGNLLGSQTTNIPTAATTQPGFLIKKSGGTQTRSLLLDYFQYRNSLTTQR